MGGECLRALPFFRALADARQGCGTPAQRMPLGVAGAGAEGVEGWPLAGAYVVSYNLLQLR